MATNERSIVLNLKRTDAGQATLVGGKGAQLGALVALDGVEVPAGFCVTSDVYRELVLGATAVDELLTRLDVLWLDDAAGIAALGAELRATVATIPIPGIVAAAITAELAELGAAEAYAVRSSATSEDSESASFAGQHDTFLNVVGPLAVLDHVRRCWASLFSDAAITYRLRNGFDHRTVDMAVVVQTMVPADAAGVLFTADPISGNRTVVSIEATAGLGEALVAGLVTPDRFAVRGGEITLRAPAGSVGVLDDAQVLRLAELGRHIESQFGAPQDVEWCRVGDELFVVQARPITTLFPIPAASDDEPHVYVSVGHQQMMTDPMKPLGLSLFQRTAGAPMHEAAGRLFVDVAPRLAAAPTRAAVIAALAKSDPLIGSALQVVVDRGFVPERAEPVAGLRPPGGVPPDVPLPTDPAIVAELIANWEASIAQTTRDLASLRGPALFDFVLDDLQVMKRITFEPRNLQVIMAGMEAAWWLNDRLEAWLGEKNAADTLAQSVPGNVTAEMGLALLDVADAIRPYAEVVAYLDEVVDDGFLDDLARLPGGPDTAQAIVEYLSRYGARCVGEIDITRPRWGEHPVALLPAILGNVRNFEAGAGPRRFEQARQEAEDYADAVLERLRALPGGDAKAVEAREQIDRLRTFTGYREYPKFAIVRRYAVWKQALMGEVDRLVDAGAFRSREDSLFLRFEELHEAVRGGPVDLAVIDVRREAFHRHGALTPPRVLTSEGEVIVGTYGRDDVPDGALVGLAVSSGVAEGRARVVFDLEDAVLEPGDILVTPFTDPSWTPVFVTIAGLVTHVGGTMTHGAVIAREYGLPAVVGVDRATERIRDGQRIRVHGTDGFVEVLD